MHLGLVCHRSRWGVLKNGSSFNDPRTPSSGFASDRPTLKLTEKVRPSGEKGSLIVIKENGKIKMKEVFKDYGTLWKVELEPAKVNFQKYTLSSHSHWSS